METITQDYALDIVDERDFFVEDLFGAETKFPEYVKLTDDEIQNQRYADPMGCVFYTGSSISNTMNYLSGEVDRISGHKLSQIAIEKGLLNPKKGAYVVSSPKLLKELGYITAYARARTHNDILNTLVNGKLLQTGSNRISWAATKKNNNVAVRGTSYGHSFFICGYDNKKRVYICENSYGDKAYDNGYFYIKYEDLDLLFNSKYVMTDKKGVETILKETIREQINLDSAKKAFDLKIWNGKNPKDTATREEIASMIYRAIRK